MTKAELITKLENVVGEIDNLEEIELKNLIKESRNINSHIDSIIEDINENGIEVGNEQSGAREA